MIALVLKVGTHVPLQTTGFPSSNEIPWISDFPWFQRILPPATSQERRYVMVASVSERRLADLDGEIRERGTTEVTPSARSELKAPK